MYEVLVNILFKLSKSTSRLPPVEKSLVCDNRYWLSAYFCEPMVFFYLAQLHFRFAYKNSHQIIIGCHTQTGDCATEGRQDVDFPNQKRMLTKYPILFNLESFFELFTSFWYTLYVKHSYTKGMVVNVKAKTKISL